MSTVKPIKTLLALMSMTKIALFVGLSLKYWENRNILNDGEAFFKTFHFRLGHHDEKFVLPLSVSWLLAALFLFAARDAMI